MAVKKSATTASKAKVETKVPKKDKNSLEKALPDTSFGVQPYLLQDSEEYMNASQNEHFKGLLNAWRATLATKIDTAVLHLKDEPKHFADLNDRATQEEEFNLELRARDREADLVVKIDEALKRLNDGDYGYCEECGVEIGLRRLEARPTATLCIDCKTLAEMRERQAGGI
jgi:DnaK suppressor protein